MSADHPRVLGVLAGHDMPDAQLEAWALSADIVFAADGAGERLLRLGITPHTTIGDMDSTESVLPLRRLIRDPDQDTSDCDKLLALASRCDYRRITLAGIEGDRVDHLMATLSSAVRTPVEVRLALRRGLGWVLCGPAEVEVQAEIGEVTSLIPLELSQGVSFDGVAWPLHSDDLSPSSRVSLSNRATANTVRASVQRGALCLFLNSPRFEVPVW